MVVGDAVDGWCLPPAPAKRKVYHDAKNCMPLQSRSSKKPSPRLPAFVFNGVTATVAITNSLGHLHKVCSSNKRNLKACSATHFIQQEAHKRLQCLSGCKESWNYYFPPEPLKRSNNKVQNSIVLYICRKNNHFKVYKNKIAMSMGEYSCNYYTNLRECEKPHKL